MSKPRWNRALPGLFLLVLLGAHCKWRSVITVFVMAQLVLQVVFFVTYTLLIVIPSLTLLKEAILPGA